MNSIIKAIFTFLLGVQLAVIFWAEWNISWKLASSLFQEPLGAVLVMLLLGPFVYLAGLVVVNLALTDNDAGQILFPPFYFPDLTPTLRAIQWQIISAGIIVVLPLLFFGWIWVLFLKEGKVWVRENGSQGKLLARWTQAAECPLNVKFQAGPCKYGDPAFVGASKAGVDFLPLQYPVVMAVLSVFCLGAAFWTLWRLRRRIAERRQYRLS